MMFTGILIGFFPAAWTGNELAGQAARSDIPNSIKITLSSGRQMDRSGAKAYDLYCQLVS